MTPSGLNGSGATEGAEIMSENQRGAAHRCASIVLVSLSLFASAGQAADPGSGFSDAMSQAMARMMSNMHVRSRGDVDRQFVDLMIPHHQGAIDMAVVELCYGTNPQLKRIAQEIIVEQQQEIAAMKVAIGAPLSESHPAPTRQTCKRPGMEH